jgi:hypothetical protein
MTTSVLLLPIDRSAANRLRAGATVFDVAESSPGYPCRQCLKDADVGEVLPLVSYDPFASESPCRSASPIYLHEDDCGQPDVSTIQDQQLRRQLSVRAFDASEMVLEGKVIDGVDLEDTAVRMLASDEVTFIHVHNASRGCWALRIER